MHITVIAASHHMKGQTRKVARWITERLKEQGIDTGSIDLAGNPLPLYSEEEDLTPEATTTLETWSSMVQQTDGIVLICPEWHGMATPAVKNLILHLKPAFQRNTPGLLVGVSSSRNGAYPIAELRFSSVKNTRICWLPEHLIVRWVEHRLNHRIPQASIDLEDKDGDGWLQVRIDQTLELLVRYAEALQPLRGLPLPDPARFPNGM